MSDANEPPHKNAEAITPQNSAANENADIGNTRGNSTHTVPTPPDASTSNRSKKHAPIWEKLAVLIALGLLVVNIGLLRVTKKAAEDANKLTREQVHIGQRAYLVFHHGALKEPLAINKSITASVDLTNSGQTPATEVTYFVNLFTSSAYPVQPNFVNETSAQPIGRDQHLVLFSTILNKVSASQLKELTAEDIEVKGNQLTITPHLHLYFFGVAHYKDVFGTRCETTFCALYAYKKFIGCPTGNNLTCQTE